MYKKWATYIDLPYELREQILVHCTKGALAALSAAAKAVTHEAEVMLYETISLHESRERELSGCLRTLTGSRSSRKAQFVHTFAMTFVQDHNNKSRKKNQKDMKNLFGFIQLALRGMAHLTTLSMWAHEDANTIGIEQVLRKRHFHLERLYINDIKDFGRLLECQPSIEVVGLWFRWRYVYRDHGKWAELKWKLAQRQAKSFANARSSHSEVVTPFTSQAHPIVFGIDYDADSSLRCLTIFDCPLGDWQRASCLAEARGVQAQEQASRSLKLFGFSAKSYQIPRQINEDMKLGFEEIDQNLCFVLPEMSAAYLCWAQKVFSHLARVYPPGVQMPYVTLSVIDLPKPPIDMNVLYEPFKELVSALITEQVDDLEIRGHFRGGDRPRMGYYWLEEDSPAIVQTFGGIIREVVGELLGRKGQFSFLIDYDDFCFPRDWHEFD